MRSPSDNAFIVARHDPPKLGIGTALEPETGQDDCASGQGEEIRETRGAGLTFFRGRPGATEYFTGPCGCLVGAVTKLASVGWKSGSAFRRSPRPGILLSCRTIAAIGFQEEPSSSQ